ncbi:MAG TPA: type II toxin-antitoxin system RatA family toxin [Pseudomonadales bacterium]|nr:type II toxin-antitoxin system RatA family toxin [Pseudomonadales bacterium]
MKTIQRSALLMFPVEHLYRLVNEVEAYPEFIEGCVGSEVLERSETELRARLDLAKAGVKLSFTTHNTMQPNEHIELQLVDGPFKAFKGEWRFTRLQENACKVEFELQFELNNALLSAAVGKLLDSVSKNLVDALCQRAKTQPLI